MGATLQHLLRLLYGRYVPEPVRNSLRLHLTLLKRDTEPARAAAPAGVRVLALAPHMDDEVFGCGGTLAQAAASGSEVTVAYVTDGSKGYPPDCLTGLSAAQIGSLQAELVETRKDEARRAGKILGLADPIFLDLPDGALAATPAAVTRLSAVLREVVPDVVYLPFMTDLHHDHWMTNCLFVEAADPVRLRPTLGCWGYEVWTPLLANTIVDITDVIDTKREAMAEFVSQNSQYDYPRGIEALNAYRSLLRGRGQGFAEAFYVADFDLYRRLYQAVVVGRPARNP
jgi:LmbE family N-acetylglucosaminyl deacetylase